MRETLLHGSPASAALAAAAVALAMAEAFKSRACLPTSSFVCPGMKRYSGSLT